MQTHSFFPKGFVTRHWECQHPSLQWKSSSEKISKTRLLLPGLRSATRHFPNTRAHLGAQAIIGPHPTVQKVSNANIPPRLTTNLYHFLSFGLPFCFYLSLCRVWPMPINKANSTPSCMEQFKKIKCNSSSINAALSQPKLFRRMCWFWQCFNGKIT